MHRLSIASAKFKVISIGKQPSGGSPANKILRAPSSYSPWKAHILMLPWDWQIKTCQRGMIKFVGKYSWLIILAMKSTGRSRPWTSKMWHGENIWKKKRRRNFGQMHYFPWCLGAGLDLAEDVPRLMIRDSNPVLATHWQERGTYERISSVTKVQNP